MGREGTSTQLQSVTQLIKVVEHLSCMMSPSCYRGFLLTEYQLINYLLKYDNESYADPK